MFLPDEDKNIPNENENTPKENVQDEPRQTYETEETPTPMWSEPRYEASDKEYNDVYSPSVNCHQDTKEKPKKEKKSHGFIKAVCIVLACVLLSTGSCYLVVSAMLDGQEPGENITKNEVVFNAVTSDPENSGAVAVVDSSAAVKIYQQAINYQVVGVNTSVNTTNIWGQETSYPVSGTGFVISTDGYILTNYHVISYAATYGYDMTVVFQDGTELSAEIVGYLEDNDVAVIKIDPTGLNLNPVTLGNSDNMTVGETVYAIGNPLGELTYTMTEGIVSATDRVITTSDSTTGTSSSMNMFQISAAVNAGNSGGPVYNSKGEVIGIVTAKYSDSGVEGLGFAIPINDATNIATQIIEKGYVPTASLGVSVSTTSGFYSSFAIEYYGLPSGAVVLSVNSGSAAEKAGILKGDIITGLNGTEITSYDELRYALRQCQPGDTGTITVYRFNSNTDTGGYVDLTITFDETAQSTSPTEETADQETQESTDNEASGPKSFGSWFGSSPYVGG